MRALLRGEEVTCAGAVFNINKVKLDYKARPDIAIFMAGRGDKSLETCGEIADGLIVSNMVTASFAGKAVKAVHDSQTGISEALSNGATLIVLDVMLPGQSGFEVLRQIREHSRVPVVMLTARGDEVDRIVGLEMGADDYLPKPFNPRELVARIRAIKRRSAASSESPEPENATIIKVGHI